jgi:hypothetical protein
MRADQYVGAAIALGFGGLYSIGFHTSMERLIAASERLGTTTPVVFLLLVEAVLFGALLSVTRLTRWLRDPLLAKITVLAAAAFSMAYYGMVGGILNGVLAGFGAMVFAAPAVGAFILGRNA